MKCPRSSFKPCAPRYPRVDHTARVSSTKEAVTSVPIERALTTSAITASTVWTRRRKEEPRVEAGRPLPSAVAVVKHNVQKT